MKRKATPAQLAARERFAEMARSGAFKRKAKKNPAKKTVSQKISQLVREGYPQPQAVAIALSEERKGKVRKNPAEAKERKPRVVLITNPQARTAKVKRSVNPNFQFAVQAQKRYPGNAVGYETVAGFPTKAQAQDYVNALLKAYPKGLTLRIMEGNA